MKKQGYKLFALATTLVVASSGCNTNKFLDVNTSPNQIATAAPGVILTNMEVVLGFNVGNDVDRTSSVLVQHNAGIGNQIAQVDAYQLQQSGFADASWDLFYQGVIRNANGLVTTAARVNSPAYSGIAKLQKAYAVAVLTDLWGDVPYSQAALGLDNISPRFDAQQDIYQGNASLGIQSLFDLVREGLTELDATSATLPSVNDDPVYSGNLLKWRRMGNTLLLKLANTISRKNPTLANAVIAEVLAKGAANYITSNADDFQVPYGTATGNQNPIYYFNFVNRPNDQILSQRLLDSMNVKNDPRLPFFYTPTLTRTATVNTTGTNTNIPVNPLVTPAAPTQTVYTFTGFQNNSANGLAVLANRSLPGLYQVGTKGEAPIRLITNFQRAFILAEYYLRLGNTANAQAAYTEGITASMTKVGLTAAQVTAYLTANPTVATLRGNTEQMLDQVIVQKWIAWVGNGYEPYNDYRRTGYPRLAVVSPNSSPDDQNTIPSRFPYPTSELSNNAANAPAYVKTNVHVWWDVR
ncbi:SusD/RagB family nutrient-binding outer membrane lipoprotein [Hymenobacter sp. HMF4947]|uniref:SusD/RagB family nutrient-binding outer membrane lipoprotein n=1 Tax=Hymenobacter ginkgonis TaxID=2682976 RepID=A0A7K1TII1_9BACT|nr:SusD/RagB family nutrient-binding outer membrane lipoprotein [Hymenobacter ginkgonis]MVN78207.1 SusD/RagB family nutrient-binding outer membrane lipoprotein [Hymenobacter ginkgonis]